MKYKYIFEDELNNYLNRFINHDNLYDVYSGNLKLDKFDQELTSLGPQGRDIQQDLSSFILHDKSNDYNSNSCNYIDFIFKS